MSRYYKRRWVLEVTVPGMGWIKFYDVAAPTIDTWMELLGTTNASYTITCDVEGIDDVQGQGS